MATLCYARQLVYETTSGAVAGGASPELRNHGLTELWNYGSTDLRIYVITDRAKWLKA